jgi:uncharacterized membrane protein
MLIEHKVTVRRAVPEVWRMISDFEDYPRWQPHTRLVKVTPNDPIRQGSMLYLEKSDPFGLTFINADLIEYQRNKMIDMKGVYGRFRFRRTIELNLSGMETLVRDRIEVNPGCLYFWYTPLLRALLNGQMQREWDAVKKALENRG